MPPTRHLAVLFALVVAGALVVPALAAADVSGEPTLTAYVPENRVAPGEETTLSVTLLNEGNVYRNSPNDPNLAARVTTARGLHVRMSPGDAPITVKSGWQAVGSLPEGVSPPIAFRVVVDEDARPGRYTVPVEARYTYTRFIGTEDEGAGSAGQRYENGKFARLSVEVVVESRANFRVVGVESAVQVGQSGTLDVDVENVGAGVARHARVTVESTNGDVTFGAGSPEGSSFVSDWRPGEVRTFQYRTTVAPEATVRSYATTARVFFEDEDGLYRDSDPMIFGFTPAGEQTFAIDEVESTLRVGEEGRIGGVVSNPGDAVARHAVVRLDAESATATPKETTYPLGDLAPGERVPFSFDVEVSDAAEAGPRQFSFVVEYRDANGDAAEGDPLDVRVGVDGKRPAFEVVPANDSLTAGGDRELAFLVTNQGDESLRGVSAKLFADDPLSASDDEAFVDRLDPGETARITFVVGVDGSAVEKTYPASIDFRYDDAEGDTLVSDAYRVPVAVVVPAGDGGSLWLWVAGAGVLTAVLVTAVILRRRD